MKKLHRNQLVTPMVRDPARNRPLLRAIRQTVKEGDVVVDLGAGTGLLSFAAAKAGARLVFAVECEPASCAKGVKTTKERKLDHTICWLNDFSYNVDLLEKADVLIQETIGTLVFEENFLATLKDAKKRLLKKGGRIIPEQVELWGAPISGRVPRKGKWRVQSITTKQLLAKPKLLLSVATQNTNKDRLKLKSQWILKQARLFRGFALWPVILWTKNCVTNASPFATKTHWQQGVLGCRPQTVQKGTTIHLTLSIQPDPAEPFLKTVVAWREKMT